MELKNIKEYVQKEKENLKTIINDLPNQPELTIFQVGDNQASTRYVRNKLKDATEVGIKADLVKPETQKQLENCLMFLNHPAIIQLPLPTGWDLNAINTQLTPEIDVDGFLKNSKYTACTPRGIIDYLDYCGFDFTGKNAVVLGRSEIVGRPIAKLLLDKNCSVTVLHSKSKESFKRTVLNDADLVICAVGKHGVIHPSMAPHAYIIDVGINFTDEGKLIGDVEILNDNERNRVTPVPGGCGLLTRLSLMKNVVDFYKK